jgi:hypothetical protein
LWSAELLAEAIKLDTPQNYESLWRQEYGRGLMATSARVSRLVRVGRGFEVVFQLAMAMTMQDAKQVV